LAIAILFEQIGAGQRVRIPVQADRKIKGIQLMKMDRLIFTYVPMAKSTIPEIGIWVKNMTSERRTRMLILLASG
jgi:hypothetical protein